MKSGFTYLHFFTLLFLCSEQACAEIPDWLGKPLPMEPELVRHAISERFVFVKGGCFEMGDTFGDGRDDEKPVHTVCVEDFYIDKYEVTQRQWVEVIGTNPSNFKGCDGCPVEQVTWEGVQDFIRTLNKKTGANYRLPTEAEWEYAARSSGKKEKWAGTNSESELREYAWYDGNSGHKTHPVGQNEPNGLGLYDMSGNVWEWVQDSYDPHSNYYSNSPKDNPKGPSSGQFRVLRGGSWYNFPWNARSSNRFGYKPGYSDHYSGFRLVLTK